MAEVTLSLPPCHSATPDPVRVTQPREPKPKSKSNVGPSVSELIVMAVANCKERRGISLAILKKTLAAGGYDVENKNSRIKYALKCLVDQGSLETTKGQVNGCYKLSKEQRKLNIEVRNEKKKKKSKKKVTRPAAPRKTTAYRQPSLPSSTRNKNSLRPSSSVQQKVRPSVLSSSSCSLAELVLNYNKLEDSGVASLCTALQYPECNLNILRLRDCSLSNGSCSLLSSVLSSGSCKLLELELSYNELYDSGVEFLCTALKKAACKLNVLRLAGCSLSGESCSVLSSVLRTKSCRLTELELSHNKLEDSGVKSLCPALKQPECKLQILRIEGCDVTDQGCSHLAEALRSNPSSNLQELYLTCREPGGEGLLELRNIEEDLGWKLKKLQADLFMVVKCKDEMDTNLEISSLVPSGSDNV